MHVGEAIISASKTVDEPLVVDSHEIQNCGVEIVNMDLVLNGPPPKVVGCPVDMTSPDAPSGQEHGEPEWMVTSTIGPFAGGSPAEFTPPNDKRFFKQAALLEVGQ